MFGRTILSTISFADGAHAAVGQLRKYTGEPYIVHPIEVLELISKHADPANVNDSMLHAAILHDTVEDTGVTLEHIRRRFGVRVMYLVEELTDVAKPEDGNRLVRVALNRSHTAAASPEAKTIKLADLISNTKSIVEHDPNFARVYLREKRATLDVVKEGDAALYAMAERLLNEGFEKLNLEEIA